MPVSPDSFRLVTTAAALKHRGVTEARIRAQLQARRWARHGHAIVLHNGPLSEEQRWHVARIHAGPRALLSGFTALEAHGLTGWSRTFIDVAAPLGTRLRPGCRHPIRLHCIRAWSEVRQTRTARIHLARQAIFVAAATLTNPRSACGLLAASVQQGLLTPRQLLSELERRPCQRHRGILIAATHDISQGAQALSEIDFARLCRRFSLPPPILQRVRPDRTGRRRYLDASWRRKDGRLVVVEIDGALHLSQRRWWDDQFRQNELALGDALILRYPSAVLRTEPELIAGQLRRALGL